MRKKEARAKIIMIAARLVLGEGTGSGLPGDYPQKSYSASRVASMMRRYRKLHVEWSIQLKRAVDALTESGAEK